MMYYLNEKLGRETDFEEKGRRHDQLLWTHRDVLFKEFKYQVRTLMSPNWSWEPREVRGPAIKYRSVRLL